jgi:hypothetical protein
MNFNPIPEGWRNAVWVASGCLVAALAAVAFFGRGFLFVRHFWH